MEAKHPNVHPIFTELLVEPLPPVIQLHCPVSRLGMAAGIGAGLAMFFSRE